MAETVTKRRHSAAELDKIWQDAFVEAIKQGSTARGAWQYADRCRYEAERLPVYEDEDRKEEA